MNKKNIKVMSLSGFILIGLLESNGMGSYSCDELKNDCYKIYKDGADYSYSLCTRFFTYGDKYASIPLHEKCSELYKQGIKGPPLCDAIEAFAKITDQSEIDSSKICK